MEINEPDITRNVAFLISYFVKQWFEKLLFFRLILNIFIQSMVASKFIVIILSITI